MYRDNPNTSIWMIYDIKFRKAKEDFPELPWYIVITPMQWEARNAHFRKQKNKGVKSGNNNNNNNSGQNKQRKIKNSCDNYNGAGCTRSRCKYRHICANCGKDHKISSCPILAPAGVSTTATSSTAKTSK